MTLSMLAAAAGSLAFAACMLTAALTDLTSMTIRNALVIALLVAYAVLAPLAGVGLSQFSMALLAGLGVLGAGFLIFALGWVGGGDVKLAAATVLWLGADQALPYLLYAAVIGGVFTLALLQFRMLPLPASWLGRDWVTRLHGQATGVPYGVALAAAGLAVLPNTLWMTAF